MRLPVAVFFFATLAAHACRSGEDRAPSVGIDLLTALPNAEIRPIHRAADAVSTVEINVNGRHTRALSVSVPTRVVFTVRIPPRAAFSTSLGIEPAGLTGSATAGVVFRVGIADARIYEQLLEHTVHAREAGAWSPVRIDLSSYGGWQWSLFYRPSEIDWQLVLNTYPLGGGSETLRGLWLSPLVTDSKVNAESISGVGSARLGGDTGRLGRQLRWSDPSAG